ncbi:PD-(D/E)XK motif protein [Streptomyces sp. NPDC058289]|uniref:PD-(D/E)XK motif protein n=1 Tax=Streptomyces sp. NPDC058289 TaxID=3346425 RepID=UPI0036E42343
MTTSTHAWQYRLRTHWAVLRTRRDPAGMATSALGITVGNGAQILVGVDSGGDHHLLVPIDDNVISEDSQAAYITIRRRELRIHGTTRAYADVTCHRADLAELFDDVLAAMIDQLESNTGERPDAVCKRVLNEWRELLRRRHGLLGEEALRGLFGELVVLEKILDSARAHTLSVWCGPNRDPHDFRLSGGDLEVKTLGMTGSTVRIHGVGQLQPPVNGDLHLVVVRLSSDPDGLSLPDLVDRITPKTDGRRAFDDALARAGYVGIDAEHYRDRRFVVPQIVALPVTDGFPRVVPSSLVAALPVEISALSYTLDLSLLLATSLTGPEVAVLFENGTLS